MDQINNQAESVPKTDPDGIITWHNYKGKFHRIDGPAVEFPNGAKFWFRNGVPHRLDGPAMESTNGTKSWWINGERHNWNGPAIIRPDGTEEWWVRGVQYSKEEVVNAMTIFV